MVMEIYFNDNTDSKNFCQSMNQQTAVLSNENVSELYETCFIDQEINPIIRFKIKDQAKNCWTYFTSEEKTVFTYELCFLLENTGIICLRKTIENESSKVSTTTIVVIIVATAALIGLIIVIYKKCTKVSIKNYLLFRKLEKLQVCHTRLK